MNDAVTRPGQISPEVAWDLGYQQGIRDAEQDVQDAAANPFCEPIAPNPPIFICTTCRKTWKTSLDADGEFRSPDGWQCPDCRPPSFGGTP